MNSSIATFLFICFSFLSLSQTPSSNKADSLLTIGKLDEAIIEFENLYKLDKTNKDLIYNYSCALALDKRIDTAFYFLNLAVEGDTSVRALNDADFYFLIDSDKWKLLENKLIERVEAKYGKYKNVELSKKLWRMKIIDQAFYYHLDVAENQAGYDNVLIHALWELKTKLNHINVTEICTIIDSIGWPKISDVGGMAAGSVFLIIQHADYEIQEKYLPLMKEAANAKEAEWSSLALLIDRTNLRQGKNQIYGSQIYRNEDGSFYVKNLEDPSHVNKRREEVGLGPIQDYVKNWNIIWDIEQEE
jgi:hypothetical protein